MIRRLVETWRRRRSKPELPRLARPNELRRDVVQAERRRREAVAAAAKGSYFPVQSEEERRQRERPQSLSEARPERHHALGGVLRSRSGLRAAWLAKEVLGPPPALRGIPDDLAS